MRCGASEPSGRSSHRPRRNPTCPRLAARRAPPDAHPGPFRRTEGPAWRRPRRKPLPSDRVTQRRADSSEHWKGCPLATRVRAAQRRSRAARLRMRTACSGTSRANPAHTLASCPAAPCTDRRQVHRTLHRLSWSAGSGSLVHDGSRFGAVREPSAVHPWIHHKLATASRTRSASIPKNSDASYWLCARQRTSIFPVVPAPPVAYGST